MHCRPPAGFVIKDNGSQTEKWLTAGKSFGFFHAAPFFLPAIFQSRSRPRLSLMADSAKSPGLTLLIFSIRLWSPRIQWLIVN